MTQWSRASQLLTLALVGMLVCAGSCKINILPDPVNMAGVAPLEADVAVGATHDVAVIACQNRISLLELLSPVVVAGIMVGFGRIDAVFYVPGAVIAASIPNCDPVSYTVRDAAFDGPAFELEATGNEAVFHAHALEQGSATFTAVVEVDGEKIDVQSTLRAWTVDGVEFAPQCENTGDGSPVAEGWLPAGGTVSFSHGLYHGELQLSGYGLHAVEHPRLTVLSVDQTAATVELDVEVGAFTLTSALDPGYSQEITTYDESAFDALTLFRTTAETVFVGHTTGVRPVVTMGGQIPCVWDFPREVTVETPTVCGFQGQTSETTLTNLSNHEMSLVGLAPGVCRVRVDQPGTALTATVELEVYDSFEEIPIAEQLDTSEALLDAWTPGYYEIWVVGYDEGSAGQRDGLILHLADGSWDDAVRLPDSGTLRAVHGTNVDDSVYAVGDGGLVARREGATWTVLDTGLTQDLYGVWVFGNDDVWVVGDAGTCAHYNGGVWTSLPTGGSTRFEAVWGAPSGTVYFVGLDRTVQSYDGTAVADVLPPTVEATAFQSPSAIHGSSETDLWLVDNHSTLQWDGADWTEHTLEDPSADHYVDVWSVGDGFTFLLNTRGGRNGVDRVGSDGTYTLPLSASGVEGILESITGYGSEVWVLTQTRLFRYVHDSTVVFP